MQYVFLEKLNFISNLNLILLKIKFDKILVLFYFFLNNIYSYVKNTWRIN